MQVQQKSVTTAKCAKDYLSKNEIPQLFECLMTGLMYHRPVDYINYLQECLEKIKKQGVNAVHWDMFLESKKPPLPPISAAPTVLEDFRPDVLPEIGSFQLKISPNSTIVIVQGGPGLGKNEICQNISAKFEEFYHIKLGSMIRERASLETKNIKSKWRGISEIINEGNLAPDDLMLEILLKELNKHADKQNFLIDGYPRTLKEREDFVKLIGMDKVKFMILVDCDEDVCHKLISSRPFREGWRDHNNMAISQRIVNYKSNTLPVCKYFDDLGKLRVIDADGQDTLVLEQIYNIFKEEIRGEVPHFSKSSSKDPIILDSSGSNFTMTQNQNASEEILDLTDVTQEAERSSDIPQCEIILLLGGPGSGKTEIASHLCKKFPGWFHVDINEMLRTNILNTDNPDSHIAKITEDSENAFFVENLAINLSALKSVLKSLDNAAQVIIIEGFPKNGDELNQLNTEIGQVNLVILLDSEEDVMKRRLAERFIRNGFMEDDENNSIMRINYFKRNGISLCRYYDERSRLNIVNSDEDTLNVIEQVEKITSLIIQQHNNSAIVEHENVELLAEEGPIEDEKVEAEHNPTESSAAVTIQASIRGYLTRKHLKNESHSVNKDVEEDTTNDNVKDFDEKEELNEIKDEEPVIVNEISNSILGDKGIRTKSQMDLQDANIILLLGGPGCGKKTLGDHLVIKYAMSFIHYDQLISKEISSESENADQIKECLETNYEDITPVLSLLRKHLVHSMELSKNIIIAGFPKTFEQYQSFVEDVALVSAVIYVDVSGETMQSRLELENDLDNSKDIVEQVQEFLEQSSSLIENVKNNENFYQIAGDGTIEQVLANASEVIDKLSFIKTDE